MFLFCLYACAGSVSAGATGAAASSTGAAGAGTIGSAGVVVVISVIFEFCYELVRADSAPYQLKLLK